VRNGHSHTAPIRAAGTDRERRLLELRVDLGGAHAVVTATTGELTDALTSGAIDIAFMPADDARRMRVDFSPPYFVIESTYLVAGNAGIKTLRQASQAKFDEWDNAVAVNFTAIYNSVAACLPHMLEHGEGGHFVTTASMGGLLPGVNAGVYTSTKIAAVGLMEALRVELESTNIGTGVFCPGGVTTDNYVGMDEPNPFRKLPPGMTPAAMAARMAASSMSPLEAGERVMNGVVNNDLFILSHPEFGPGMKERYDAIMASTPPVETPIPPDRIAYEQGVMHCGIYPREIAHRQKKRSSYRSV